MTYPLPRDRQGRIIVEPLFVSDDDPEDVEPTEHQTPEETPDTSLAEDSTRTPARPRSTLDRQLHGERTKNPVDWKDWAPLIVILLIAVFALRTLWPADTAAPAAAVTTSTPSAATEAPTATPAGLPLPFAAVAYDAPDGNPIDAIEPGRICTPVQRPSEGWVQIDCTPGGLVWVQGTKVASWPNLPALPTATPVPTPRPTAVPAPAYQPPVYQPPAPPRPTPTPEWTLLPVVGRAESPDGVLVCESRISQADAEACLAQLLTETAATSPGP